jgi:hypothetical protein
MVVQIGQASGTAGVTTEAVGPLATGLVRAELRVAYHAPPATNAPNNAAGIMRRIIG